MVQWTNHEGHSRKLVPEDVLVVAPYNVQVSDLSERLRGMRVGTLGKFQGQEAPVVIYSFTSDLDANSNR